MTKRTPPKFNFEAFLIASILCCVFTFITFLAAAAKDEGMAKDGLVSTMLEKLFYVFRFPTHTLFFQFMNGSIFYVGLLLNALIYGLLIERVISFYKSR